jgi:alanyl-tRNA synthetase
VRPEELPERVEDLVERLRVAEKEIEQVRLQQLLAGAGQLAASAQDVDGTSFVGHEATGAGGGDVRRLALDIRGRLPAERPGVAAIVGTSAGKPSVVVAVNDAGRAAGISANTLVRAASEVLGGKGGGKDDVAQGGGADTGRAQEALAAIRRTLTGAGA